MAAPAKDYFKLGRWNMDEFGERLRQNRFAVAEYLRLAEVDIPAHQGIQPEFLHSEQFVLAAANARRFARTLSDHFLTLTTIQILDDDDFPDPFRDEGVEVHESESEEGALNLTIVDETVPEASKEPRMGRLSVLREWNAKDSLSDFERRRKDRIFELQGNRNPFIDRPEWIGRIWKSRRS